MTTTTEVPAAHALIIPCPPGTDSDQLLEQLVDAAAEAGEYREKDADPDCGNCIRNPAAGTKTLCRDCQVNQAALDRHNQLFAYLAEYAEKRAAALEPAR